MSARAWVRRRENRFDRHVVIEHFICDKDGRELNFDQAVQAMYLYGGIYTTLVVGNRAARARRLRVRRLSRRR